MIIFLWYTKINYHRLIISSVFTLLSIEIFSFLNNFIFAYWFFLFLFLNSVFFALFPNFTILVMMNWMNKNIDRKNLNNSTRKHFYFLNTKKSSFYLCFSGLKGKLQMILILFKKKKIFIHLYRLLQLS